MTAPVLVTDAVNRQYVCQYGCVFCICPSTSRLALAARRQKEIMDQRQTIPRWRIALLFLPAIFGGVFSAIPMQITMRFSMLAGMMAFASALFAGLGVFALMWRPKRRPDVFLATLCIAAGFAFMGQWLWQMGQAWHLPRLERRALDMTTLPMFGMLCIVAGGVGIVLASAHTIEMERMRKAELQDG